jgi:hypothetical protein
VRRAAGFGACISTGGGGREVKRLAFLIGRLEFLEVTQSDVDLRRVTYIYVE